jgi:hypothetical protein
MLCELGVSAVKSFPLLYASWQSLYSRDDQITRDGGLP